MSRRTPLAVAAGLLMVGLAAGQEPPAAGPGKKPLELFRFARDRITEGRYELAADVLKEYLAVPATDQDYLDVESKFGPTSFYKLRNVQRWYDDPKREAEFRERADAAKPGSKDGPLELVIKGSLAANAKLNRDPARVRRYVQNLGATREEQLFSLQELKRAGDAVIPAMVESLRLDTNPDQQAGLLVAVRELGPDAVPGFIAAAEGLPDPQKIGILKALAARADAVELVGKFDTDITPLLWHLSGTVSPIQQTAADLLRQLSGGASERRDAATELVRHAGPALDRKARFATLDAVTKKVKYSAWDATANAVQVSELTAAEAEERIGLKILAWATAKRPGFAPAEEAFVALATERAVERAKFADLAKSDPGVYQLLAAAPAPLLGGLLDTALVENRTALAFGLITALGDRADKSAAAPVVRVGPDGMTVTKPGLFARVLTYPDPRVQVAAAVALLRSPGSAHGANARIVDVLKRAAGGDPTPEGVKTAGRVLLADPMTVRADQLSEMLVKIGYTTEQFGTGRDLLRRIQRASDFDFVVLDRHIVDPQLTDVLAQFNADANFARRPVLIVASADAPRPVGLEHLLVRLAVLIAVTETDDIAIPQPLPIDQRKNVDDIADERKRIGEERDRVFATLHAARLGRLQRLVAASGVVAGTALKERLDLRLPQLTYAAIVAEYQPSRASAPGTFKAFDQFTALVKARTNLDGAADNVPTAGLVKLILQLEGALTPKLQEKYDQWRRRTDAGALGLSADTPRDPRLEQDLARRVRGYVGVGVIGEPFSAKGLEDDLAATLDDPAAKPRSPAEKSATAKLAVTWLKKMATGEVAGYDVKPAEPALRQALLSDDLAATAADALVALPTAESQQDLLKVALSGTRPAEVRAVAADALARHIQAHGRLTTGDLVGQLTTAAGQEANPELKARLGLLRAMLAGTAGDLSDRIRDFKIVSPAAAPKAEAAPPPAAGDKPPPVKN